MQNVQKERPSRTESHIDGQFTKQSEVVDRPFGQLEPCKYSQIETQLNAKGLTGFQKLGSKPTSQKQYASSSNNKPTAASGKGQNVNYSSTGNQKSNRASVANQLPINLFHSAAEYRRILITKGKSIVSDQYSVDGILTSLQYINQPIYEAQQQKAFQHRNSTDFKSIDVQMNKSIRNSVKRPSSVKNYGTNPRKSRNKQKINKVQSSTDEGRNSYSEVREHNMASKCQNSPAKSNRINYSATIDANVQRMMAKNKHTKENIKKLRQENLLAKPKLCSTPNIQIKKNYKTSISVPQGNLKNPLKNKRIQQMVDQVESRKRKENIRAVSAHNRQISRNSQSINSLLFSSMCKFQEKRRMKAVQQNLKQKLRQEKQQKLKQLDFIIRMENKEQLAFQKPNNSRIKKIDKKKIAFDYWASIKSQIKDQLAKSTVSKKSILKAQKHEQTQSRHRQHRFSAQQIQALRQKHEKEAIKKINEEKRKEIKGKKRIARSLDKLERQIRKKMKNEHYEPFRPSQKQIQLAFVNLNPPIEPKA